MAKKEYAIWGTKDGNEDIIRVNGQEVQTSLSKTKKIVQILRKRGDFEKVRIQTLNMNKFDLKSDFIGGIKSKRR